MSGGLGGTGEAHTPPIQLERARIRSGSTHKHLDQGRLARTILSQQRMHCASSHAKIDTFEGHNASV
jgi:hypothetical protein